MKSSGRKIAQYVVGAIVIFGLSFFITLALIDYWEALPPLKQPIVDITTLPSLSSGQTLDFADSKNRNALLSGWSHPEPGAIWTSGHATFLAFIINGTAIKNPTHVSIHAVVFLAPPVVNKQRVEVWSAADKLAQFELKQSPADLLIPLGDLKFDDGTPLVLGFYLPDAASPASAHMGGDTRVLALKMSTLQLY